jgi:pilus assembly protein CpaE
MKSDSSINQQYLDPLDAGVLSIALIGPDEDRRKAVASAFAGCEGNEIREYSSYPVSLGDVPKLLEQHYDVIVLDLDSDFEYALKLVEIICASDPATVMVYSMKTDPELLVRCMRAGAREFLTLPLSQGTVAEALVRASARRLAAPPSTPKKAGGRLLGFLGAKGGDGVTTLACNFAVSLAQESKESTVLIDLDLPLGDAALNLGIAAEYSTINALQNARRLDSSFLSNLLVKHSSGVSVLAAPGRFPKFDASNEDINRLIAVARQDFDNVVVDMGSKLDLTGTSLFKEGSTIYLVIQADIAGLRNANRLISQYFATGIPKLEIVLNRFQKRNMGVAEELVAQALTRPAKWKIPNDYAAVRRMQHTAIPLALEDSPISRLIRQMARTACGLPEIKVKKPSFSFKRIGRSLAAMISSSEQTPASQANDPSRYVQEEVPEGQSFETPAGAVVATLASKPSIDAGDWMGSAVFEDGTTIHLVMQPGRAGLSNSNRIVSQFVTTGEPKPEIVINQVGPSSQDEAEGQTSTTLARRVDELFFRLIGQMVHPVSVPAENRKSFNIKDIGRALWMHPFALEKSPAITHLGLAKSAENTSGNPVDLASQNRDLETRTFNGSTHVKGKDGQWHLQKTLGHAVNEKAPAAVSPALVSMPRVTSGNAFVKATSKRRVKVARKHSTKAQEHES